ncbi:MAG: hypothetical protein AAB288_10700 [Acidobacteriota bacterium]
MSEFTVKPVEVAVSDMPLPDVLFLTAVNATAPFVKFNAEGAVAVVSPSIDTLTEVESWLDDEIVLKY